MNNKVNVTDLACVGVPNELPRGVGDEWDFARALLRRLRFDDYEFCWLGFKCERMGLVEYRLLLRGDRIGSWWCYVKLPTDYNMRAVVLRCGENSEQVMTDFVNLLIDFAAAKMVDGCSNDELEAGDERGE